MLIQYSQGLRVGLWLYTEFYIALATAWLLKQFGSQKEVEKNAHIVANQKLRMIPRAEPKTDFFPKMFDVLSSNS